MDLGLTDKIAIVTGSSRGLGLASARALVAEGCRVCLCARGEERLAEAAVEVEASARRPGMVLTVQADVSTAAGVELVMERTVERFGGVDVLVNNVGKAGGTDILGTTDAQWQSAFDETLFPAIRASRLAVPLMRQRGGGVIILIASIWGREPGRRSGCRGGVSRLAEGKLGERRLRPGGRLPGEIEYLTMRMVDGGMRI